MSFTSARRAVESFFAASWAVRWPEVPVAFENVPFTPPEDRRWVKLAILNGQAEQISLGRPALRRHRGRILVECFTPSGTGAGAVTLLADRVVALFDDALSAGGLAAGDGGYPAGLLAGHVLLAPELAGPEESDGLCRIEVAIPFRRDETV